MESYKRTQELITLYMQPALNSLQKVGCFDTLDGPIMNVLRKAFQTTHSEIIEKIVSSGKLKLIATEIHGFVDMPMEAEDIKESIDFLKKVC